MTEQDIHEATLEGSILRLRPKVMTVSVVLAGLLPIMWSTAVGADVMKPIAAPILGGMITSTVHVLIITPVIFALMKRRALRKGRLEVSKMGFGGDGQRDRIEADDGLKGRSIHPVRFRYGPWVAQGGKNDESDDAFLIPVGNPVLRRRRKLLGGRKRRPAPRETGLSDTLRRLPRRQSGYRRM